MVIFLTVLLGISIVGLLSLIVVKRWELSSGKVMMASVRPKAGYVLGEGLEFVEKGLPVLGRQALRRGYKIAQVLSHRLVALVVLHTERVLERTLHTLRGATAERGAGEASEFLREVAEHKKSLMGRSGKKPNAIYEE